jgi:hypothetical protein
VTRPSFPLRRHLLLAPDSSRPELQAIRRTQTLSSSRVHTRVVSWSRYRLTMAQSSSSADSVRLTTLVMAASISSTRLGTLLVISVGSHVPPPIRLCLWVVIYATTGARYDRPNTYPYPNTSPPILSGHGAPSALVQFS